MSGSPSGAMDLEKLLGASPCLVAELGPGADEVTEDPGLVEYVGTAGESLECPPVGAAGLIDVAPLLVDGRRSVDGKPVAGLEKQGLLKGLEGLIEGAEGLEDGAHQAVALDLERVVAEGCFEAGECEFVFASLEMFGDGVEEVGDGIALGDVAGRLLETREVVGPGNMREIGGLVDIPVAGLDGLSGSAFAGAIEKSTALADRAKRGGRRDRGARDGFVRRSRTSGSRPRSPLVRDAAEPGPGRSVKSRSKHFDRGPDPTCCRDDSTVAVD